MAGFWSRLLGISSYDPAQRVLPAPYEPFVSTGGIPVADPGSPLHYWTKAEVEQFWRSQPNLRKVVGFVARGVASIPLHVHERVSDTDRRRVTDHPLASVLSSPRPGVGSYRFWESVISDGLLYDRWAVLKQYTNEGLHLVQLPSWRLYFQVDALRRVTNAFFWTGDVATGGGEWRELDLSSLIYDYGYAPQSAGLSPVETLKDLLDETAEAVAHRREIWENGGNASQYIKRPLDAKWTGEQRGRFVNGLRAFKRGGKSAGGIMLLEDGMEMHGVPAPSSKDLLDLEGRQLSAAEVASAFFVAPELVGAREGTFSNIDAFRQMTYRDSLGPYITAWEQAINVGLTPDLTDGRRLYVEANVEAKLRGSFIEQAQIMQSATGAPWMSRNEARAMQNRPPIDGGDELVVPLNVLVGGQASPRDSGSQNRRSGPVRMKEQAPESHVDLARRVFSDFFARQARVVKSRLGAKAEDDWWDGNRWDDELAKDLYRLAVAVSERVAHAALEDIGFGPDQYDTGRTLAFLKSIAERTAGAVNATTLAQIHEALAGDDPAAGVDHVFEVAEESRAEQSATSATTAVAGFATFEAAKQVVGTRATKTWVVNSSNPRSSHAAMNGETVGLEENFSNGAPWPGSVGNPDEDAGCQCSLRINRPDR